MMKGYKGFEKGLICKGKQYAENTVFEEDGAEIYESGMHFCKNPFDVLEYYPFVTGDYGIAIATGVEGKARGAMGCYIAVAEWAYNDSTNNYDLIGFKSHKVDGEVIKPNTFYSLKNGKFNEVD